MTAQAAAEPAKMENAAPETQEHNPDENLLEKAIANTRPATKQLAEIVDSFAVFDAGDQVERSLILAVAMTQIRERLDVLKPMIMELMNRPIGFLTDRDPSKVKAGEKVTPYEWDVVRDCVAECLLSGGRLTGNEFNIIAGKKYDTQQFFKRKFRELAGVTDVQEMYGSVVSRGDRAYCNFILQWMQYGKPRQIRWIQFDGFDRRIGVRINSGMGDDAILGKATRKAYKAAYEYMTGRTVADNEDADEVSLDPFGFQEASSGNNPNGSSGGSPSGNGSSEAASERQLNAISQIQATRRISDERMAEICMDILQRPSLGTPTAAEAGELLKRLQSEKPGDKPK